MISQIKDLLQRAVGTTYTAKASDLDRAIQQNDQLKLLAGKNLAWQLPGRGVLPGLSDAEFSVFSQFGDDGIVQYLIHHLKIQPQTFIEFGVENYTESNTRFLLINNQWRGLVIDGSKENVDYIKNDTIYWKYKLT